MLEQHEVAAYLLERGLLRRSSIVSGALRVSDASSRNRNHRVRAAPGESYLLKQGSVADAAGGEAPARRAAEIAAEIAASRHAASLDGWPCGPANAGWAPGLLGGHAEIGLLYLRLHDRGVPSPLLIGAPIS